MYLNISAKAYLIPGGEQVARDAYDDIADLLNEHEDLLACYIGPNRSDGLWFLVLVGFPTDDSLWAKILEVLTRAEAQYVNLPAEALAPHVERFLTKQVESLVTGETWFEGHYPLPKEVLSRRKQREERRKKRRKKHQR